jgi:hypothetical protein
VINGALEAVVVHGFCARQLPAHTHTHRVSTSCMQSP